MNRQKYKTKLHRNEEESKINLYQVFNQDLIADEGKCTLIEAITIDSKEKRKLKMFEQKKNSIIQIR